MDKAKIEAAMQRALASGITAHPGLSVDSGSDWSLQIKTLQVAVSDPKALDRLVDELVQDKSFEPLQSNFLDTGPLGELVGSPLRGIAESLLAQVLAGRPIKAVLEDAERVIAPNKGQAVVAMALVGIDTDRPIQLGPDVRLVPTTSLPPSTARGAALGQSRLGMSSNSYGVKSAASLITEVEISPLIVQEDQRPSLSHQQQERMSKALNLLDEARNCLTLVDLCAPKDLVMWSYFTGPSAFLGGGTGYSFNGPAPIFWENHRINAEEAERISSSYFSLHEDVRKKKAACTVRSTNASR